MTLALFSLAGIPPFAGFFSKFFVFAAASTRARKDTYPPARLQRRFVTLIRPTKATR